jgi:RimJ/RimL family protein N-acetyltransferase
MTAREPRSEVIVAGLPGEAFLQPVLDGPTLHLRPLHIGDFEPLYAVASDPLVWEQHPEPLRYRRDVFDRFFAGAMASRGALLAVHRDSGKVIGTSRYYDLDEVDREIAIGYTFLSREFWGGVTNTEMKRLMLEHAFGWAEAVWFHVGPENFRPRSAWNRELRSRACTRTGGPTRPRRSIRSCRPRSPRGRSGALADRCRS